MTSPDGHRHLRLVIDDDTLNSIAAIVVTTTAPASLRLQAQIAPFPAASLRGIRLGSTLADIVAKYGQPTSTSATAGYPWAGIVGAGDVTYSYCDDPSGKPSVSFLLEGGRVIGLALWSPDC